MSGADKSLPLSSATPPTRPDLSRANRRVRFSESLRTGARTSPAASVLCVRRKSPPDTSSSQSTQTVAAATWDTRGGLVFYRMFFDTVAMLDQDAQARRARAYTRPMTRPGELVRAWSEAGLQDVVQDTLTIRMDFQSFADFWAPCEGKDGPLADYVGTLGEDARASVRDAVMLAYLDGDPDGPGDER